MNDPIFYVVEVAMPAHDFKTFMEWYAGVHAPHLFQAGFTTCTSYATVSGGLPIVDVYQAPAWDIFESVSFENYRRIAARDPYRPEFLNSARNMRTVYTHASWSSAAASRPLDTDWLTIWRFSGDDGTGARIAEWLALEGEAQLIGLGASHVRLLHRSKDAPTGQSPRPAWALVTEWAERPPLHAEPNALLPKQVGHIPDGETFTGFRLFPWANNLSTRAVALENARAGEG